MPPCVLCAVDDSPNAGDVIRVGARLKERLALRLVIAHAVPAPVTVGVATAPYAYPYPPDPEASREAGEALVERIAGDVAEGTDVDLRALVGDPAESVLSLADEEDAELIVVGSRRRGAVKAALLGSVSSTLATRASCPVVVVPPERDRMTHMQTSKYIVTPMARARACGDNSEVPQSMICGVDDSDAAREAVRVARDLSDRLGRRLILVHVFPADAPPGTSAVPHAGVELHASERQGAEALLWELAFEAGCGTDVERRALAGQPPETLREVAQAEGADLLVLGSRRRGGLAAALLGSVSRELASTAPCPVVIVPAGVTDARASASHEGESMKR
ncbi:MAG: universal stress protein [Actinomycetota bacterium]|nr:universal stress protein [Actinomycetota bacterium]